MHRCSRNVNSHLKPNGRRIAYIFCVLLALVLPLSSTRRSVSANSDYNWNKVNDTVDALSKQLGIGSPVHVEIVQENHLMLSVEPTSASRDNFVLSMEADFLRLLDEEELTAALAHELGHVWIYTHHPFLHTETLANQIAMRVVSRDSLNKLYVKLWAFSGDSGTIEDLLGPDGPTY
jgi:hypothetical protein